MATRVELVTVKLREMIATGELTPGTRVPERDIAASFEVSRTPVRLALGNLEAEGLVKGTANCGFVVCDFKLEDILGALDVRGVLEGFAVRMAIERGVEPDVIYTLTDCVEEGERLVAKGLCGPDDMRRWSLANQRYHTTLIEACDISALNKTHEMLSRMPMVAPVAIYFSNDKRDDAHARMEEAHRDHLEILDAIRRGQATRAEALVREHVYRSRTNLERLLTMDDANSVLRLADSLKANTREDA